MATPSRARRAFGSLWLLGLAMPALVLGWLAWQGPQLLHGVWQVCQNAVQTVAGSWTLAGVLLPGALLTFGLLRGAYSLLSQLGHTWLLLRRLRTREITLPADLAASCVPVRLADDNSPFAFAIGFHRPQIWISSGLLALLTREELAAVLHHEQHHVQQHDPWRVLWARSLAEMLFFLPLAAALRDDFLDAKEQEADRAAPAGHELASALLKLVRFGVAPPPQAGLAAVQAQSVAVRIRSLLDPAFEPRRLSAAVFKPLFATVLLVTFLAGAGLFSTRQAAAPLTGGECGYTIQNQSAQFDSIPATFTPAY